MGFLRRLFAKLRKWLASLFESQATSLGLRAGPEESKN